MLITKVSMISGKTHTMDLPVTDEQLFRWKVNGELIQNAMPHLTSAQREFLISGSTSEEWDELFKE